MYSENSMTYWFSSLILILALSQTSFYHSIHSSVNLVSGIGGYSVCF